MTKEMVKKLWENYFQKLLNQGGCANDLEPSIDVEGKAVVPDKMDSAVMTKLRGISKLNKFQKSKLKLDISHPTHTSTLISIFFKPSLTRAEQSNHDD